MIQFPQLNHICKFENTFFEAVNSKKLVNEDMQYCQKVPVNIFKNSEIN